MRKRKWLLVVVLILIVINLIFWGMTYLFDVNTYVKNKLTNTLGKQLEATISFSNLNITSKILQISDLEIHKEGEYTFRASQLYIHYSFWQLILHNFKIEKALKEIRCFSPEVSYILDFNKERKPWRIDLDALEKTLTRFNYISIINGQVSLQSDSTYHFTENIDKLNINLQKKAEHEWHISLSAYQQNNNGVIQIDGMYARKSNDFTIIITDYSVPHISSQNAQLLNAMVNADIETDLSDSLNGSVVISNIAGTYSDELFQTDTIDLSIHPETLTIKKFPIRWRNHEAMFGGEVRDYLNEDASLDISFVLDNFHVHEVDPIMLGRIDVSGNISDSPGSPEISITTSSEELSYKDFNIYDFIANLNYKQNELHILQGSFIADTNLVILSGNISVDTNELFNSKANVSITSKDFTYIFDNYYFSYDVEATISGSLKDPESNVVCKNLLIKNNTFTFTDLLLKASFKKKRIDFQIDNVTGSVNIKGFADFSAKLPIIETDFVTKNLTFTNVLNTANPITDQLNPIISAQVRAKVKDNLVYVNGLIDLGKDFNSKLDGILNLSGEIPLVLSAYDGFFNIGTDSLYVNNEPIGIVLQSSIFKDDRFSAQLDIGKTVTTNMSGTIAQDSIRYAGNISIDSLEILKVNQIFSSNEEEITMDGFITAFLDFAGTNSLQGTGHVHVKDLSFSKAIHPVDVDSDLEILSSEIALDNIVAKNSQTLLFGNARLSLDEGVFELNAEQDGVLLEELFFDDFVSGSADYSIIASGHLDDPRILCDVSVENGQFFDTSFNTCKAQVFQDSTLFYLKQLEVLAPDFNLTGNGSYSYNFLKEEFHDHPDMMRFSFSGDLLKILSRYTPLIKNASSKTDLMFSIKTEDTNTIIDSACICISDGEFSIKSQPEKVRNLSFDMGVKNNIVTNLNGSLIMGDGKLFIKNKVNESDMDIYVGDINIGTILLNNDDKGITIHIPNYQPDRGLVDVRLVGYNSEYFSIFHEDGGWVLSGRILLSNGDAIYEEEEEPEEAEDTGLPPIYADFDLVFDKNTWYVSNPFNLKIDPGDYMSFRSDRETEELELFFDLHSRQGEMRLFGELFSAEDVFVRKARKDDKVFIDATFTKRTPDGSTIYLYVRSTEDKLNADDIGTETYGDVEVILKSDNPNDVTMLSILSKIQYGKEIDELSEEERFDLGTEQAINLASDELSNLIFSPIISPVEGVIRQILGLDFVRFKTGFMKNIILTSGIVESDDFIVDREYDSDLELLGELSKDILLENLAIDLGKYITPQWYLNYEALIKKEMSSRNETYIGVQHELSFTWDLPYNFRFIYRYQFYPAQGKDNQGISLETVLHF